MMPFMKPTEPVFPLWFQPLLAHLHQLQVQVPPEYVSSLLASGSGVEVQIEAEAVLACPLHRLQEVCEASLMSASGKRRETKRNQSVHFHATCAKNGSPSNVSSAQYGTGIRTQLSPARAISAKSSSVCDTSGASDAINSAGK